MKSFAFLWQISVLFFVFTFSISAQNDDEQVIRKSVAKINEALIERNVEKLAPLLNLDSYWNEHWKNDFERGEYRQYPIKKYSIRWLNIEGNRATVRVFWERTDAKSGKDLIEYGKNHQFFYFRRVESNWVSWGFTTMENELIRQIITAETDDERKNLIRAEKEVHTQQIIYVIIFRFRNEGNFAEVDHYLNLAEWYGEEFYKTTNEFRYVNNLVNLLNAKAANQKALGNNVEALQLYLQAAKTSQDIAVKTGNQPGGTYLTSLNIAALYLSQGNLEQAERFALRTLDGLKNTPRERQPVLFGSLYTLLGDIYFQRGELGKALEYYQRNIDFHLALGAVYLKQNKLAEALIEFQHQIDATEREVSTQKLPNLKAATEAFCSVSEIYLRQNKKELSLQMAQRAVEFAEKSKNPELIFVSQNALGKAFSANENFTEAENSFRKAIETVEVGRQKVIGGEETQVSYFENRIEPYQKMIEVLVKSGNTKIALEFAERAKSRVLNEILQSGRIQWQQVLNSEDKQKEQTFRSKMNELNRLQTVLKNQPEVDKKRLDEVTKQLAEVRSDYEFLQTAAFANYPELRRSRGIGKSISANEIVNLITQPNEALLQFTVTEHQIYLFVATKEKTGFLNLQAYPLNGKTQEILSFAKDFRQRIIDKNLDYQTQARSLYDLFFKQADKQLVGKTNWTIVPDGELWNLPFAALKTSDNKFLIESKTLNFAQSFTASKELKLVKSSRERLSGNLFAIGNPRIDEKTIAQYLGANRDKFGDLPDAETEVFNLQKIYGKNSKVLIKTEAREDVWKNEAGKYRVLHLATHGLANSIKPLYSHLFLAADSNQPKEDGLLEAWEIMNLRLNADLAILSACETAQGRTNSGEGLIGLSWVFAVANVPRVVASQWKVESSSTAELMTKFHRQMQVSPTNSVAKSLQTAMQSQIKSPKFRHPFYWAGFISIGNN